MCACLPAPGYPLRSDPVRLDVVSVAAYNGSRRGGQEESFDVLEKGGGVFSEEGFSRTLRNIAGLLEAAAVHGADHLILGALGCGAFGNSPKQVAGIFKTLLPAFAGHFKTVDFAILEGGDGDNNCSVFRSVLLDGAQKVHLQSVSNSGFRKMLTFQKMCPKLGRCEDVSSESHLQEFWHPDMCPSADCAEAGDHCTLWRHQLLCPEQNCKVVFGPSKGTKMYERHCELYKHKKLCWLENCQDSGHTHPPLCPHGVRCRYKGQNHRDGVFYSHRMRPCPDGTVCSKWNDADHLTSFAHVFNPPCCDPMHCELLNEGRTEDPHFHTFSHLCRFGSNCRKIGDSEHQKGWIHLDRPSCPEGAACAKDKQIHFEDHLQLFQHPNVKLIRDPCRRGRGCRQLGCRDHRSSYKHDDADGVLCAAGVWGHNTSRNLMEKDQTSYEVHFHQNAKNLIKRINSYFKSKANKEELSATAEFWRRCRVVHRLPYTSFSKVLKTGFVASQHCLQTHALDPEIACHLPSVQDLVQDPVKGRRDVGIPSLQEFVDAFLRYDQVQREAQLFQAPQVQVQVAQNALGGFHAHQQRVELHLQQCRAHAERVLGKRAVEKVEADLVNYSSAMKELKLASEQAAQKGQNALSGIGHEYDRVVETNKMVFGILGIHTLNYGEDKDGDEHDQGVHLIFKPESLHHPDVFVTPMAATFYNSGRGDDERPWWKKGKPSAPFDAMAWEKLHPSSPAFHEALATEFLARAAHKGGGNLARVKFTDVKDYIKGANAHFSAECHLPYVTPLAWVEKVVVSEHTFKKLSDADQLAARETFGGRLEITPGTASQEQQWKLATAPLRRPSPPPAFAWTVLATRHQEVVLPAVLQPKARTRIFFRASRADFVANLSMIRSSQGPVSLSSHMHIAVRGENCTLTGRKERVEDPTFNSGLGAEHKAVMYCIDLDGRQNRIQFTHAGVSSMLNPKVLEVCNVNAMPKFLSFSMPSGHISFSDVRIVSGADDEPLLEHERPWTPVKRKAVAPLAGEDRLDKQLKMTFEEPSIGWMTRAYNYITGKGQSQAPFCSHGADCKVAYYMKDRSQEDENHMNTNRHICLYGKSCREQESTEHDQHFSHIEKDTCAAEPCDQLCDPFHRAEYHHPGMWDLLLPCRDGALCKKQSNALHCQKYHHQTIVYVVNDEGVQVQAEAASKKSVQDGKAEARHRDDEAMEVDFGFDKIDVEVQDRIDDMAGIYNDAAISGDFGSAQLDIYGNPVGGDFDLARDGAFEGFKILVLCAYHGEGLPAYLQSLTIPELSKKGFNVKTCMAVDEFTQELRQRQYHVAWILSSQTFEGNKSAFLEEIQKFHEAGRGLMIWGDNDPFYVHANLILEKLFGFRLMGNTPGTKELRPGNPRSAGHFGGLPKVCAGIVTLYEGITICYPNKVPEDWLVFGTSSNNHPVLVAREASSERPGKPGSGRVIVDNGFTKLYESYWSTAGTARYVSNCSAWLVLRERFRRPQWGFNPVPQYHAGGA